jgi:hypothetical protein
MQYGAMARVFPAQVVVFQRNGSFFTTRNPDRRLHAGTTEDQDADLPRAGGGVPLETIHRLLSHVSARAPEHEALLRRIRDVLEAGNEGQRNENQA